MNYCIIDDEPIAHRIIEGYCDHLSYLQKVGNCYDAFQAVELLHQQAVDLMFLDIHMPKLSGFDFLKTIQHPPKVIVTSAHQEFALEGYELSVADYLLKPFSFERFLKAMQKVSATPASPSSVSSSFSPARKHRFFLKGDKKMHHIHAEDILFIEAYGNYTKVYLAEEMIVSHEKISSLEALLPASDFMRVHKSFIVSTDKIKMIEGNRIMMGGYTIPIGQTYKHRLKTLFRGD
ncbi:MAG: LytTR family DNA-binding domain-containing protein [Bacteroidota bacterium]